MARGAFNNILFHQQPDPSDRKAKEEQGDEKNPAGVCDLALMDGIRRRRTVWALKTAVDHRHRGGTLEAVDNS